MKNILLAILCTALLSSAHAQTTKTLTLSSNGVVSKPADFWSVNAPGISSALTLGTAATSNATAFATAAQGAKADTAVQPTRTIATGAGMAGGGNLTSNLTLTLDSDLTALAAASGTGLWAITGTGTGSLRTLTAPAAGLTITNPAGTAGNPTFALANDLGALEALGSTGIAVRTGSDAWTQRTIAGTTNYITLTNGDGVAGNPTVNIGANVATTDTTQTITAPSKTLSGNLIVNGNANFGDAAGDDFVATDDDPRFPNLTPESYSAATDNKVAINGHVGDARYLVPLQRVLSVRESSVPITSSAITFENLGFSAPLLAFQGIRFQGTSTTAGDYSGSTSRMMGVGSGTEQNFDSRFALEFSYSQGTNSGNVSFVFHYGANNRNDLTGRGIGIKIQCGTGQIIAQVHDGSTLTSSTAMGSNIGNLFAWRYLMVWDGVTTLTVYGGRQDMSSPLTLMGSVSTSGAVSGEISSASIRCGYWAAGPSGSGLDALVSNIRMYQY